MNWKWGVKMNRGKCIYYVEGPCEQQLISALKEAPEKLIPGKIKVFNDYEVDAVYADSDFDLEREIRLDFFQPSDRITDCCKSGDE